AGSARTMASSAAVGIAQGGRVNCAPGIGSTGAAVVVRRLPRPDHSRRADSLLTRLQTVRDRVRRSQPLRLPAGSHARTKARAKPLYPCAHGAGAKDDEPLAGGVSAPWPAERESSPQPLRRHAASAESCIRKAGARRGLTPGPAGLADPTAEDEAATGTAVALWRWNRWVRGASEAACQPAAE